VVLEHFDHKASADLKILRITWAWRLSLPNRISRSAGARRGIGNRKCQFFNLTTFRQFYRLEGATGGPVLVLSHSDRHRITPCGNRKWGLLPIQVLRYDTRRTRRIGFTGGVYSVEQTGPRCSGPVGSPGIFKAAWCAYPWEGRSDNAFPFIIGSTYPSRAREHLGLGSVKPPVGTSYAARA